MNLSRFLEALRSGANPDEAQLAFKGGSKTTTTNTPTQSAQYKNLLSQSDSWLKDKQAGDQSYGVSDPVANLTQDQLTAIGNQSGTGSALNQLYHQQGMNALSSTLGSYDPNSTGLTDAIKAANNQTQWQYDTTVLPQLRQGATDTGQYGSTRHGVAEGIAAANLGQTMANNASTMAYNDQQNFLNRQTAALNNLTNITNGLTSGSTAQYNAGALQQSQDQAEIQGQLEKWAYDNNVDYNTLAQYKNLITGDMGGKTVQKTQSSGGLGSMLGTIGGMALGSFMGPMGASLGASIGGQIGGAAGGGSNTGGLMSMSSLFGGGSSGGTGFALGQSLI